MPPRIPAPREEEQQNVITEDLEQVPSVTVLGRMNKDWAIRVGWMGDVHTVSTGRLRFLKEELKMKVRDNPDEYVL